MNEKEQIQHFADEIDKIVERFRSEYDISYASVVGALQMKCFTLMQEANDRADEV